MKITKIKFTEYLHFSENFELDLTYPNGCGEKSGKPLDKVCFIGQSGTGKTTILDIIKLFVCEKKHNENYCIDLLKIRKDAIEIFFDADTHTFSKKATNSLGTFLTIDHTRNPPEEVKNTGEYEKGIHGHISSCRPLLMSFPFCVVNSNDTNEYFGSVVSTGDSQEIEKDEIGMQTFNPNRPVWDFSQREIMQMWDMVFYTISKHIEEYKNNKLAAFDQLESNRNAQEALDTFNMWLAKHPNPIEAIARDCLDPILGFFNLKVETDIKHYQNEVATHNRGKRHLTINNKNSGETVKYPFLSTGTKQIILTSVPLYFIKPQNSIILFDQPEASLYPNVQSLLPKAYTQAAQLNNQFFFATHSPIVASSFDPWEIVELQFDDNTGKVVRKEYYDTTKERHADNYCIFPKFLSWDSNMQILFNIDTDGGQDREDKIEELSMLEQQIELENNPELRKPLVDAYLKLARMLDWDITNHTKL